MGGLKSQIALLQGLSYVEYREVYLKSEVDEVIAEKDIEIVELKEENAQLMKEMKFMHSNCKWHVGDGCARLLGEKLAISDDNVKFKQKLEDAKAEEVQACQKDSSPTSPE